MNSLNKINLYNKRMQSYRQPPVSLNNRLKKTSLRPKSSLNSKQIYCIVRQIKPSKIRVIFYQIHSNFFGCSKMNCPVIFTQNKALILSYLIELHREVYKQLSTSHALYLGIELMKVELSVVMQQKYIQN
jgi:hypothetical protein